MVPWLDGFIAELLKTEGDIDAAADSVHVTVPEIHGVLTGNKVAKFAFDRTMTIVRGMRAQRLESVAFHEAAYPSKKFKFTPMGEAVMNPETGEPYYEVDRDNRLVMSLLKALDRPYFGDRQAITGGDGGPIQVAHQVATLADVLRLSALLDEGKVSPDEVVGEIVDAEIVNEEV